MVEKSVMIRGCENIDVCGTPIGSQDLGRTQRCGAFSVIRRLEFLLCVVGGKNGLRSLRFYRAGMVRSQTAPGTGFGVRGLSDLLGDRGAPDRLPAMHEGEAREASVACGQSVLQQAIRVFCGTALPDHDNQRRCSRNASGLADGQGVGQAVYEGAATQDRRPSSQGHWG